MQSDERQPLLAVALPMAVCKDTRVGGHVKQAFFGCG
jgi:hypothetical protein